MLAQELELQSNNFKHMPTVGMGTYELRVKTEKQYRVFYVTKFEEAIYVLHAFVKKTQKTSQNTHTLSMWEKNMSHRHFVKGSGNAFKDIGFDKIKAKNLKFRSYLMNMIIHYIQHENLTQTEAAKRLAVKQPRISNLMHGKIDLFSVDMLLNMVERMGVPIYKKVEADAHLLFKKYEKLHSSVRHLST